MRDKQANSIIRIIYVVATILVLVGAIFKIQHYPNGSLISIIGFIIGTVTIIFDRIRLKKKMKKDKTWSPDTIKNGAKPKSQTSR